MQLTNRNGLKIDLQRVEELMSEVTRRMTTTPRFRFDLSPQQALDLLAAFYAAEVNSRGRRFIPDDDTSANLAALATLITAPCPKPGIILCGTVGNGKTTLMKAFQRCVYYLDASHHFEFLDDKEFDTRYRPDMHIVDVRQILTSAKSDPKTFDILKNRSMLGIDDLGKEPAEIVDYGNILSPVVDLIEHRYDRQLFTVITTNLPPEKIREKYGDRIADRFNEMLGRIIFRNTTYRTISSPN